MTFTPLPKHARIAACALGLGAIAGAGAGLASPSRVEAQAVDCASLTNPVFGIGGSAATNLIKKLGQQFAKLPDADPKKVTVVYADPGACSAMSALVGASPTALSGSGKYWDADGKELTCTFAPGTRADWGAMAQEATTCQGIEASQLGDIGTYKGPISGFSLIVPDASDQQSISAEAVYYIYNFGAGTPKAEVAPWVVPAAIGSRTTQSAAGLLLAKAVGIDLSRKLAHSDTNDVKNNQAAVDFITKTSPAAVATPSAALAFCSTETADANRPAVRTLAFKAQGQDCAYGPDSTTNATDKKNLREGRYFLWNPHYIFVKLDANKSIPKPALRTLVDVFTSKEELPSAVAELPGASSYLDLLIANGNVPECAMRVTRTGDMGPLASYQPEKPCGCYFDSKTTAGITCKTCTTDTECGGGTCNYGFCEVK